MTNEGKKFGRLSVPTLETLLRRACSNPENTSLLEQLEQALKARERLPLRFWSEHDRVREAVEQLKQGHLPDLDSLAKPEEPVPAELQVDDENSDECDFLFLELATPDELAEFSSSGLSVRLLSLRCSPERVPALPGLKGLMWHEPRNPLVLPPLLQLILIEPHLEHLPEVSEPEKLTHLKVEAAGKMALDLALFRGLQHLSITGASSSDSISLPPSKGLRRLDLENCGLVNIEVPCSFDQLTHLNLAHNALREFPFFGNTPLLCSLKLSHNPLASPPKLVSLTQLKSLDLGTTNLQELGDERLFPESLARLSLAGNSLRALPDWVESLTRLEFLRLDGNRFQELPNLFKALPRLKTLHCSDNPMQAVNLPEILVPPVLKQKNGPSYLPGHIGLLAQSDRIVVQGERESKHLIYDLRGQEQTWTIDWLTYRIYQPWTDVRFPERYEIWRLDETRAVLFASTKNSEVYLCDLEKQKPELLFTTEDHEPHFHLLEPGVAVVYDSKICVLLGAEGQITRSPISEGKMACCGDHLYRLFSTGVLKAYTHQDNKLKRSRLYEKAEFSLQSPRWYSEPPENILATELIVTPDNPHVWGRFGDRLLAVWEKESGTCVFAGLER